MAYSHYYRVLGVSEDATPDEIRHAYRMKALDLHPDRNPSPQAHEDMKAVNQAYDVLSSLQATVLHNLPEEPHFEHVSWQARRQWRPFHRHSVNTRRPVGLAIATIVCFFAVAAAVVLLGGDGYRGYRLFTAFTVTTLLVGLWAVVVWNTVWYGWDQYWCDSCRRR